MFELVSREAAKHENKFGKPVMGKDGKPVMYTVSAEQQFSGNWMERVSEKEPVKESKPKKVFGKGTDSDDDMI